MGTPIDVEKLRSLMIGKRTRDKVNEWRSDDGERHKATTDENNNTVTQHARGDRQDVLLRPQTVRMTIPREAISGADT